VGDRRAWVESLARIGFGAKGVVYLLLGGFALAFAFGGGGEITDAPGAVARLLREPYGRLSIGALAVGLALYSGWRVLEAIADTNRKGAGVRGIGARVAYGISALVYGALALDAVRLVFSRPRAGDGAGLPPFLLDVLPGAWSVTVVSIVLIVYGALQVRRAFSHGLSGQLNIRRVSARAGEVVVRVSRFGIGARGVVLTVTGIVIFRRAESLRAAANTGTDESLRLLATLPTGDWVLACIAAGLMAYGVFQLVQARYRMIAPP
jgi:hypothetical protein